MSGIPPVSATGYVSRSVTGKKLFLSGFHKANVAHILALIRSTMVSREEGASLVRSLLELEAKAFDGELGELPRSLESSLQQRLGGVAAWLHADRPRSEAVSVGFLIAVRTRILDLARTHLDFAQATVSLADTHQSTIITSPAAHGNGTVTTLGHCLLTYVYPVFRDLERLQHCYQKFNSSPFGAGRNATGARLPIDFEFIRTLLGFDERRSHSGDALWQADGPIELMAAIVALLVNLNRLADDLRPLADAADSSSLAWIRPLTSGLLSKVPELASLGKQHDGNSDSFVRVAEELCTAFDGALHAVGLLTSLVARCADNAANSSKPGISSATQSDLVNIFVTRGSTDYATAEKMVNEIERLIARREIELGTLTPDGIDVIAIQVSGRPLNLTTTDLESAIEPEQILRANRGPGGISPQRVVEMITECRARVVRENFWITVAGQRLRKSEGLFVAESRETAGI
jgi:argininosuccinate lyase